MRRRARSKREPVRPPAGGTAAEFDMRASVLALLSGLALAAATAAVAQSSRTVPVQEDLRRFDQVERRLGERGPDGPPARGNVQSDPTGVAGYTGPPGGYGESVNSFSPLPQGAAGADIR